MMRKVRFCSLSNTSELVIVKPDDIWGNVLNAFFHQYDQQPGMLPLINYRFVIKGKIIGHDIALNSSIKDLKDIDIEGNDEIKVCYVMGGYHYMLKEPWNAWILGKPWPPCSNYYGNEPFNQKKIGYYHGKSHCSVCDERSGTYEPLFDNTKDQMVILYDGIDKIAYNKYQLLERKITIMGHKLDNSIVQRIKNSKGNFEFMTIIN